MVKGSFLLSFGLVVISRLLIGLKLVDFVKITALEALIRIMEIKDSGFIKTF